MEPASVWLQRTFLGNTLESWLWAAGILLAGLLFKKLFSILLTKLVYLLFKKYSSGVKVETFLQLLTRPVSLFIMLIILYVACNRLQFPAEWNMEVAEKFGVRMVLIKTFQGALMLSFLWILLRITDFFGVVFMYRARLSASKADDMLVPFIKEGVKILLGMFGLLAVLGTVFNLNVVTLIGGLGIGGLAVALAAKETLENLLGSFLIFLDKPFIIGDQIKVGSIEGIIEDIGFRSTRIRTFERTVVTVPNKKMVDAELENQTKREHRRARFTLALTYDAQPAVMKTVSSDIEQVLKNHPLIEKETTWVRFREFSPSSLDLQVNYFVHTPELEKFLEVREEINYRIMELVKKNGLEFAYPSTTVYMKETEKQERKME